MEKYRFFSFTNMKGEEDYCRADNLRAAIEVFKRFYPKASGVVKEGYMSDYDPPKLKKMRGDNSFGKL